MSYESKMHFEKMPKNFLKRWSKQIKKLFENNEDQVLYILLKQNKTKGTE